MVTTNVNKEAASRARARELSAPRDEAHALAPGAGPAKARASARAPAKSATTPRTPRPDLEEGSEAGPGEKIDASYLEGLIGYNARRAALSIISVFLERMAVYGLRPVDFSALSLITHNPGINSRQLSGALGILPPNLVGMVNSFEKRALIIRRASPKDGRAYGLYPTPKGQDLMEEAEKTALNLEKEVACKLSAKEQRTLMSLLQKIYL